MCVKYYWTFDNYYIIRHVIFNFSRSQSYLDIFPSNFSSVVATFWCRLYFCGVAFLGRYKKGNKVSAVLSAVLVTTLRDLDTVTLHQFSMMLNHINVMYYK